jgi:glutaredoxin
MSENQTFYIYSKDGCGYCSRLTEFMDSKGIAHVELKLGEDYSTEEFLTKFGRGSTFPQVNYKNQNIGGMRETVTYLITNKIT